MELRSATVAGGSHPPDSACRRVLRLRVRTTAGAFAMQRLIRSLLCDEAAATSVEYAVMLALILGVVFGSIALLGQDTLLVWNNNNNSLQSVGFGS